ncbi:hypothetical protein TEA_018157 [Camellia sinensis var. sinensis]|uniref:PGG domain-containing protein n=1 Tax=Camellia sinensis var. sinensis TaxID=542762 RepID=A0A4V6RYB5_CAMSN|nr:hypothetical protein TEA_018157 [Camellia sinensis var. sinensis]
MAMAALSSEKEKIDMDELVKLISVNAGAFSSGVIKNDWNEVLKIYESFDCPEDLQRMKITRSEERALHMALQMTMNKKKENFATFREKREKVVKKLIEGLQSVPLDELADNRGNTPLHVAAKLEDQQKMCIYMAHTHPEGIGDRNHENETPLFLAALYGCKESFIALSDICCSNHGLRKIYEYGRRSIDGSTVLHCAVNEEYFGARAGRIINFVLKKIVVILEMKEKHRSSIKLMNMLLREVWVCNYTNTGGKPTSDSENANILEITRIWNESQNQQEQNDNQASLESSQKNKEEQATPILIAAKNGISEMVSQILDDFPVAIYDTNPEGKNVMLLALENRKLMVYKELMRRNVTKDLLHHNDNVGNNALHHAAMVKIYPPSVAPNAVLRMQWEIKWYEFIKEHLPKSMLAHQNKEGMTPDQVFMDTHADLVQNDTDWLMKTSDSCTIVAALIATVAFATSASLPGGIGGVLGEPVLKREGMFEVFAISSLVALCFSLTAVLMFLSILTSRHQAMDFHVYLPRKLLIGLTALFISIASMLVSFCGGHFFVLRNIIKRAQVVEYLVGFLPVMFFIIAQCPLYIRLFSTTIFKRDP